MSGGRQGRLPSGREKVDVPVRRSKPNSSRIFIPPAGASAGRPRSCGPSTRGSSGWRLLGVLPVHH